MQRPWLDHYRAVPRHLDYPQGSMSDAVLKNAVETPEQEALSFMGVKISYGLLGEKIRETARAFWGLGVRRGARVTLCMPNVPQTVYCLYALNEIGAEASLIHPLSAEKEIVFYLSEIRSTILVTLRQFYDKAMRVQQEYPLERLILTDIDDALTGFRKWGYRLAVKSRLPRPRPAENLCSWKAFLAGGRPYEKA